MISIPAFAGELKFCFDNAFGTQVNGPYGIVYQTDACWTQSSSPIPLSASAGQYTEVAATGQFDYQEFDAFGTEYDPISNIVFNHFDKGTDDGGFTIKTPDSGTFRYFSSEPIYSGSESDPSFKPGFYNLDASDYCYEDRGNDCIYDTYGELTVTAVPTPEPDSWAMMLLGLGAIGCMARQRRLFRPRGFGQV